MEMHDRRSDFEALGATVVAVGFSPDVAMAALADHLEWSWAVVADPERLLYRRLGLDRASLRQVFSPGAVARYRAAAARGVDVHRPVEDARQLGADVVVVGRRVEWLRRQTDPDDRPSVTELLDAAATAAPPTPKSG